MVKLNKKRYLAIKIDGERSFNDSEVIQVIQYSISRLFGEYGASKAEIRLIKNIPEKGVTILQCSLRMVLEVRAAIASITRIDKKKVIMNVIEVSGTINSLIKKI